MSGSACSSQCYVSDVNERDGLLATVVREHNAVEGEVPYELVQYERVAWIRVYPCRAGSRLGAVSTHE
jgi:hypothetical protein